MNTNSKKFKSITKSRPTSVTVVDGDISYALRQWKRILKDTNSVVECYDRMHYNKPSTSRRKMKNSAKYRQQKQLENQ